MCAPSTQTNKWLAQNAVESSPGLTSWKCTCCHTLTTVSSCARRAADSSSVKINWKSTLRECTTQRGRPCTSSLTTVDASQARRSSSRKYLQTTIIVSSINAMPASWASSVEECWSTTWPNVIQRWPRTPFQSSTCPSWKPSATITANTVRKSTSPPPRGSLTSWGTTQAQKSRPVLESSSQSLKCLVCLILRSRPL